MVRIPISVLILRSRPMRWVPSDAEAVPFLPHLLPNVGVSIPEESALRLQNCRRAVGSDCHIPGCVLQEKRQGKRLPLHNMAPSRQHLGDATHFGEGAAMKGTGNNSGRHDTSTGVFRGTRGVGAKNPVTGINSWRLAPNPRLAGRQAARAEARRCCVSNWGQPSDPQGFCRPLGVKFVPVGRRGRPASTPQPALEEDVLQSNRFLTQGALAFGSFGSGKESALPHRSKASKVVGLPGASGGGAWARSSQCPQRLPHRRPVAQSCDWPHVEASRLIEHAHAVSFPPLLLWGALCAYRGPRLLTADGLVAPPAFARKGILAGCPLAVALSKVALWPACSKVLNQKAVASADTWVDDLSVDFCGANPQQVAAKGLRVARALFGALAEEGLEVSFQKTTWIASSPAVEAALKQQSHGDPVQVSSVAKDLGVANAAGRARRTHIQAKRLRKGTARGLQLHSLKVHKTAHRVRVSKMGCLSAAFWGHQGLGLSPKQLRIPRTLAAQAGRRQQLGSVDVVFSLGEGNCCDPLRTIVLQHWRTLHRLLFSKEVPDKYLRLWKLTWAKLKTAPKRWALVKGPIAATIAYLQDHAVDASDPIAWRFPVGSLSGPGLWDFSGDAVSLQPGLSMAFRMEEGLSRLLPLFAAGGRAGQTLEVSRA
eukprot:s8573_g2.t1